MTTRDQESDREAVRAALDAIVNSELPKSVHLTEEQHKHLMSLLEFAAMVASIKRFGVPAFNLAVTAAGVWLALKAFILGGGAK